MSETTANPDAANAETTGADAPQTTGQEPSSVDALPAWAQKLISDLRDEAAGHRTAKATAVEEAKASTKSAFEQQIADVQAKLQATEDELTAKAVELMRLHATLEADIPSKLAVKFASLIKGTEADEIKAQVAEAKGLFGNTDSPMRAVDPSQGKGNNNIPLNGDPLLAALKGKLGIQ